MGKGRKEEDNVVREEPWYLDGDLVRLKQRPTLFKIATSSHFLEEFRIGSLYMLIRPIFTASEPGRSVQKLCKSSVFQLKKYRQSHNAELESLNWKKTEQVSFNWKTETTIP